MAKRVMLWLLSTGLLAAGCLLFPREGEWVWRAPRPPVLSVEEAEGGGGARIII